MKWTEEEDALIIKLRSEFVKVKDMLEYFPGRSYSTLRVRAAKIAGKNSPWSKAETELLMEQYSSGVPPRRISVGNRDPDAIRYKIRQLVEKGLLEKQPSTRVIWDENREAKLIELRVAGKTNREIAQILDLPVSSIDSKAARLIAEGRLERRR